MATMDLKQWTVMVYLAGENNLAEECVFALNEMRRAAATKEGQRLEALAAAAKTGTPPPPNLVQGLDYSVRVIAQLDASGLGGNEDRYILTRDRHNGVPSESDGLLHEHVFRTVNTTETSYRQVLKDFLSSSVESREAHNVVILSGHGSGADGDFLSKQADPPDTLSIPKLQWVLSELRKDVANKFPTDPPSDFKIDLLGIDACLMSMAETCFELRKYVDFLVGAEGFEPNTGWPYERILTELFTQIDSPGAEFTPKQFAVSIVKRYIDYYRDYLPAGRSVDLAACRLDRCDDLAAAVKVLAQELSYQVEHSDEGRRAIVLAHWEAQSYKNDSYVDLYDFCNLLSGGPDPADEAPDEGLLSSGPDPAAKALDEGLQSGTALLRGLSIDQNLKDACDLVKQVLKGDEATKYESAKAATSARAANTTADPKAGAAQPPMIMRSCYSGPAVQYSHGLSVYFPWAQVSERYAELEFAQATGWYEFLVKYVKETRRAPRACSPPKTAAELQHSQLGVRPQTPLGLSFLPPNDRFDVTINSRFDVTINSRFDVTINSRLMGNSVGSMKNPPIAYFECPCAAAGEDEQKGEGQTQTSSSASAE